MKHIESAGLVIVYDGMILLGHTTGGSWYGSYSIPKGTIELGEDKITAAIRETKEELGIKVPRSMINPTEYSFSLTTKKYKYTKTVYYFLVEVKDLSDIGLSDIKIPKKQLQLNEIDWAGFISYNEAIKRINKSQIVVLNKMINLGLLESNVLSYETYTKRNRL